MGGERETILKKDASDVQNGGTGISLGDIRCHENQGHIHFHDDANQRKVAIPTGVWFQLHEQLMGKTPNKVQYIDSTNLTMLIVKNQIKKAKKAKKAKKQPLTLTVSAEIVPINIDHLATALKKFTEG